MKKLELPLAIVSLVACLISCRYDNIYNVTVHDPNTSQKVSIDRFSTAAGHLQVRTSTNGLPAANAAVNFDTGPFITKGLGPSGEPVEYYNFDVQPLTPAQIYVLFRDGETMPVSGQLNIINVLPGEPGYSDFWQVNKVTVPANYQANQVASYNEIIAARYPIEQTTSLVNCPVVPEGSTAAKRFINETNALIQGWYDDKVVYYFSFDEKSLSVSAGQVPLSTIYVTFNINPSTDTNSGPASGFMVESGSGQTHNVVAALPTDQNYSPLWAVVAYDDADFSSVNGLIAAQNAPSIGNGLGYVNCPIVKVN